MVKRISRLGIYHSLDKLRASSAEEWLDEKQFLDWEFLADEGLGDIVVDDNEDVEDYLERKHS
jgi:hypothetical protein